MNILVVDDHEEILEGIKSRILHFHPNAICHFATKSRDALFIARGNNIDLLLTDLEFKNDENDGWHILGKILQVNPKIKSIAYTTHGSYNVMKESLDSGFNSFLEKGCSLNEFGEALQGVFDNGYFESESIRRIKKKRFAIIESRFRNSLELLKELSPREVQVAVLLSETLNINLISDSISTAKNSVKSSSIETYVKRIMTKLMIHNRTDLSLFCAEFKNELLKLKKE